LNYNRKFLANLNSYIIAYIYEENSLFIFDGITYLPDKYANVTVLSNLKSVNNSMKNKKKQIILEEILELSNYIAQIS